MAKELRRLGVKGILITAAEQGYITDVKCGIRKCRCREELGGASYFVPVTEYSDWNPTHEHAPRPREMAAKEPSTTQSLRTGSATGSTSRSPMGGHTRETSSESEKLARRPSKLRNVSLGVRVMRITPRHHRMTVRKYLPNPTRRNRPGSSHLSLRTSSRLARGARALRRIQLAQADHGFALYGEGSVEALRDSPIEQRAEERLVNRGSARWLRDGLSSPTGVFALRHAIIPINAASLETA